MPSLGLPSPSGGCCSQLVPLSRNWLHVFGSALPGVAGCPRTPLGLLLARQRKPSSCHPSWRATCPNPNGSPCSA